MSLIPEEYDTLLEAQDYCCAICGKGECNLSLDRDNSLERAYPKDRGLLCPNCHEGIRNFKHNPESLAQAIQYLNDTS